MNIDMKKFATVFFILISLFTNAQAPNWIWAKGLGGSGGEEGTSIASNNFGETFVSGHFNTPNIIIGSTILNSNGSDDVFISKSDSAGNILWAKNAGGSAVDLCYDLACDNFGNVFATGSYNSSGMTFDNITITNNGSTDAFIAKYNNSGSIVWAKTIGGIGSESSWGGITIDASGNVYLTGQFSSTVLTVGTFTLNKSGNYWNDFYLIKLDNNGNVKWAKSGGGLRDECGTSVSVDLSGNVFITGYYTSDTIKIGSDTLINAVNFSLPSQDIFLIKYDNTGSVKWAKSIGGSSNDIGRKVINDNLGFTYLTGYFASPTLSISASTFTLPNNGLAYNDILLLKYDLNGSIVFGKNMGGGDDDFCYNMTIDTHDNLYLVGTFGSGYINFGTTALSNTNTTGDIFVAAYTNSGNNIWALNIDGNSWQRARDISFDSYGNAYVIGDFNSSSLLFGSSNVPNNGSSDVFVSKLGTYTEIQEFLKNKICSVYPNPVVNYATIKLNERINAATIQIENNMGKVVQEYKNVSGQEFIINIEMLKPGMYYIKIIENNTIINTGKFVVSN